MRRREHGPLGGGGTLAYTTAKVSTLALSASGSGVSAAGTAFIGHRLHPVVHAGFQLRVGAMALFGPGLSLTSSDPGAFGVIPWAYLAGRRRRGGRTRDEC